MITEAVTLPSGETVAQHLIPGVAPVSDTTRQIAASQRAKAARRGHAAPPMGGLFDTAAHGQQDLFS